MARITALLDSHFQHTIRVKGDVKMRYLIPLVATACCFSAQAEAQTYYQLRFDIATLDDVSPVNVGGDVYYKSGAEFTANLSSDPSQAFSLSDDGYGDAAFFTEAGDFEVGLFYDLATLNASTFLHPTSASGVFLGPQPAPRETVSLLYFSDSAYASATPTGPLGVFVSASGIGVPEPGTWAMMLLGFGMVGFGMRYRRGAAKASFA